METDSPMSLHFFEKYLKYFGLSLKTPFSLKDILISIQSKDGVLKSVLGLSVPSGFDFSNESLYKDQKLKRIFTNMLVEPEMSDDFDEVVKHIEEIYVITSVDLSLSLDGSIEARISAKQQIDDVTSKPEKAIVFFKAKVLEKTL
jgi:hypothetical protein